MPSGVVAKWRCCKKQPVWNSAHASSRHCICSRASRESSDLFLEWCDCTLSSACPSVAKKILPVHSKQTVGETTWLAVYYQPIIFPHTHINGQTACMCTAASNPNTMVLTSIVFELIMAKTPLLVAQMGAHPDNNWAQLPLTHPSQTNTSSVILIRRRTEDCHPALQNLSHQLTLRMVWGLSVTKTPCPCHPFPRRAEGVMGGG